MYVVLEKSLSFVFIIALGYVLKKKGIFKKENFSVLSTIVLKITLPSAIIYNFSSMSLEASLLSLCVIGLVMNILTLSIGYLLNVKKDGAQKAFDMLNLSGFNIGSFALPFAQNFLGPLGVVSASLYDTGNSIMCTGLSFSVASMIASGEGGFSLKKMLKSLLSSIPFDCYIVMTILAFLKVKIPSFVVTFSSIGASANAFIAMFMIGIGMELAVDRSKLKHVIKVLVIRAVISLAAAFVMYHLVFFPEAVRQGLTAVCLAPISAIAPAFTGRIDGDIELASTINSFSIIISILMLTGAFLIIL